MDLKIEAVCYSLGILADETRLYSFIHDKVISYGGLQQFRENVPAEVSRIRLEPPQAIHDFVMGYIGFDQILQGGIPQGMEGHEDFIEEMRAILESIPLDMEDIASHHDQLLGMLTDPVSIEHRLRIYEAQVLPKWREYTEEQATKTLREKYNMKREERIAFVQRMEKLNSGNSEPTP